MKAKELDREERIEALNRLITFCHANLYSSESKTLQYLRGRGIYDATARLFNIGSFPSDLGMLERFMGTKALADLGVVYKNYSDNSYWSRFSDHPLIIPIYDSHGEPEALMGRTIMSEKNRKLRKLPKYINSPFKKSKCLYGLNFSKNAIRLKDRVYVTEGNFDVISAYQNGMKNVVATSGTFLSKHQIVLLSRYTNDIRILMDNDVAGKIAEEKVLKKYSSYKSLSLTVAKLPSKFKDLDEYFKEKVSGGNKK